MPNVLQAELSIRHSCAKLTRQRTISLLKNKVIDYFDLCVEIENKGDDTAVDFEVKFTLPVGAQFISGDLIIPKTSGIANALALPEGVYTSFTMPPSSTSEGRVTFCVPNTIARSSGQKAGLLDATKDW